ITLWNIPHGGHVRYDAVTPAAYVHRMQKSGRELVLKISSFGYLCTKHTFMQMQSQIDVDFGMHMEQQLENFSWVHRDENMNVPLKQEGPNMQFDHTYRDITCSASSSLKSYSGLFGKSSNIKTPKIETSSIPGTSADPS
ncbi:unnamed protein product, partial [Brassica rapa]